MKRMLLAAFLFGLLGVGCMPEAHQVLSADNAARAAPRQAPPVLPEQVTRENAYEMIERVQAELRAPAGPDTPAGMELRDGK
jgi:hypothetical protein